MSNNTENVVSYVGKTIDIPSWFYEKLTPVDGIVEVFIKSADKSKFTLTTSIDGNEVSIGLDNTTLELKASDTLYLDKDKVVLRETLVERKKSRGRVRGSGAPLGTRLCF